MICDKCKSKEAVIHRLVIINGSKREQHFCQDCAKLMGILVFKLPTFAELAGENQLQSDSGKVCSCKMTFEEFRETGMLGCQECYKTFENELMPVIARAQVGRTQQKNRNAPVSKENELAALQKRLDEAVAAEEYEEAAVLRDRIRALSRDEKEPDA